MQSIPMKTMAIQPLPQWINMGDENYTRVIILFIYMYFTITEISMNFLLKCFNDKKGSN